MRRLRPLQGNQAALHDAIAERKRGDTKTILRALRPRLHRSFVVYQNNYTNDSIETQVGLNLNANQAMCCLHCYETVSEKRNELIAAIRSRQDRILAGTCQYCCVGKPNSIDHYLPKADFPEFSVFALNLLPCCGECNGKKGNYWLDNGVRAIINFYKDTPPNDVFLHAQLIYTAGDDVPIARFSARWAAIRNRVLRLRVKRHFNKLELLDRYKEASIRKVTEQKITLTNHARGAGISAHRRNLRAEAADLRRDFGNNFWQAALCNAMADSTQFLQSIES